MGDPLRLYGLNALVLNAGSGIGEASARTLAKHGATVVAADTINSGVERHFKSVKGITGMVGNLRDADKIPALVQEVVDQVDGLDIVVNDFPLAFDMPMSAAAKQLDSLLQSRAALTMSICRAALPYLKRVRRDALLIWASCAVASPRMRTAQQNVRSRTSQT